VAYYLIERTDPERRTAARITKLRPVGDGRHFVEVGRGREIEVPKIIADAFDDRPSMLIEGDLKGMKLRLRKVLIYDGTVPVH
jgi:hypothetical protein